MSERDLQILKMITEKHIMFSINKVEDFKLLLLGYSFSGKDELLFQMNEEFSKYLTVNFDDNLDVSWDRHIRVYSANDNHSIDLFKIKLESFLETKGVNLNDIEIPLYKG